MIFVANWKMQLGVGKSERLARALVRSIKASPRHGRAVVICPSFPVLDRVSNVLRGTNISLGAQDVFWEKSGAFTGEVSPTELKELGCRFVIVGHSERRHYLGETDAMIGKKVHAAIAAGLTPILCVGEPASVRRARRQASYVTHELKAALRGMRRSRVIVAYEPRWAIGTGKADSPNEVAEMVRVIHETVGRLPVLYGGSVTEKNASTFLRIPGIQGALVGGASLDAMAFSRLIQLS